MNLQNPRGTIAKMASVLLLISPAFSAAQVPVDDEGNVIGTYEPTTQSGSVGENGIPLLSAAELQELVGPVALYPDDLLAIVLPASAYPIQIAAAARFLEAHKTDASLKPDPDWDDTVIALINYPEVIELLNADLDWTYRLGEAVVAQQTDVVAAVESFRDRAYASGNLKSDSHQTVSQDEGVIEISPVADDVIYVPYYEPERVVVYQSRPSYFYYPRPYPVYYYPYSSRYYSSGHYFDHGYFWGVTTAFSIGWLSDSLHVHHHSYRGHPYYGRSYHNRYWYRRPSISIYNNHYGHNGRISVNRYSHGDRWRARNTRRTNPVREGYARSGNRSRNRVENRSEIRSGTRIAGRSGQEATTRRRQRDEIRFRQRGDGQPVASLRDTRARTVPSTTRPRRDATRSSRSRVGRSGDTRREQIEFRPRNTQRQPAVQPSRETRRQQPVQARESRRQRPEQSRGSRRQEPVRQARQQRERAAQPARRQAPVRQARQGREPATQQRAPAPQQRAGTRRSEQQPRQQESGRRDRSGSSESPRRQSGDKRGRSRDRRR